jgi:tetratricopeptide (TPR) repeat protein/transcriptional regulator with XRE-family HTH domain
VAIGGSLRAWRERALLTQEQLAERSGMSVRSIRRLESGAAARPRSSSVELLAAALGLSAAERALLTGAAPPPAPGVVPRQLPAPPPGLTGRAAELADLGQVADPASVVVTSIDGMAGVGKTALAVHVAHRLAHRYPDGQLFCDLHGHTEGVAPVDPADALDRVLRALGVPGEHIPDDPDDRAALYRSRVAGRRVLVLLDNAASEAQVAPLLPGTPGCLVLVTSRRRLVGLDQTRAVSLDVLPLRDAITLFTAAAGEGRTTGAPDAVLAEVAEACGRLPLALRIAAARLRSRPAWSVADLVGRLRDHGQRLAELEAGSRSVAAALEASYRDLPPPLQRAYRLLSLHPGADLDRYAAAVLLDSSPGAADRLLEHLIDAHLLPEPSPGRFAFHDLVRAHARAASARADAEAERRAARTRLCDLYRHAAAVAMDVAYPHERSRRPDVPPAGVPAPGFADAAGASAWLERELPNLVAAARHAAGHDLPRHAAHLAATLHRHLYEQGRSAEALAVHRYALDAARAAGDAAGEADALVLLGKVHWWFHNRLRRAAELFEHAADVAGVAGHRLGQVQALTALGAVCSLRGAHERAPRHFAAARAVVREVRDPGAEFDVRYFHAWHRLRCGEPAHRGFERCLAESRARGDRNGEWLALHGLGYAHLAGERGGPALRCFERALRTCRAVGDRRGTLGCLIGIASVHRAEGRGAQAASRYQEAVELARLIGNPNAECEAVHGFGRLACATGRPEQAVALFGRALDLATRLGRPVAEVRAHDGLAHAHRLLQQPDRARQHLRRALDILTDLGLEGLGTDLSYGERITASAIRRHLAR